MNIDGVNGANNVVKPGILPQTGKVEPAGQFGKAVEAAGKYVSKVDNAQHNSDASIKNLLTGKNTDINSVVSAVAEADMSFKLLVGVRNQLVEAYKATMNMPL